LIRQKGIYTHIKVIGDINEDYKWYLRLHGWTVLERQHEIVGRTDKFTITTHSKDDLVIIKRDCELLEGCLCKGHPDKKPLACRALNEETSKNKSYYITPGCMYED
jgi:hypothetical protein